MDYILAPSILSADFLNLGRTIEMLNRSASDWLHLDIMDGVFVPNISFGFPVVKQVATATEKPMDAHLMIVEPDKFITRFRDLGIYSLTVQYEACTHLNRTLNAIREAGMKAGVALNPHTPIEVLTDVLDDFDMALVMSVNPGFGGQKFIPRTIDKVRRLRKMLDDRGLKTLIEVDGGVNLDNARQLVAAGVNALVVGNTVFKSPNPEAMIKSLKYDI
ncbi:MAG: ribulose-phosphate 3-epimerase [Dysgonamonadaceae bacterium]|jgi:ribulose-phosphate 3-epimerase|nr:ribulose-phosphate 3-epimerase [Dysgonamonadaceae bacterium]